MNKRRWLLWVLIASFFYLVITRFNEIENLAETLSRGLWLWVLVAALLQVIYFFVQAKVYQTAYRLVQVSGPLRNLVSVLIGSVFVNTVAPSGGTAGLALYVDDAVQRGESGPRATAGTLLGLIGTYTGFGLFVIYSLLFLRFEAVLRAHEIVAAIALLIFTTSLSAFLILGAAQPVILQRILQAVENGVNSVARRLRRSPFFAEGWATRITDEFRGAAEAARANPGGLIAVIAWAVVGHTIQVLSLYTLFLAFRYPLRPTVVISGYTVGHLFVIMAPTPQGVGFVETVMPITFTALGVPSAVATIVVLAYRGLTFWLPLLGGFFLLQRLKSLGAEQRTLTEVWSVRIVALLTALTGLVNIVSVVYPGLVQDLQEVTRYAPLQLRRGGQLGAILSGLALLLLANALWRRKRAAWLITCMVLLISAASHILNRSLLDYRSLLTLALGGWLLALRPHFHARSDPPSVRYGLGVLSVAIIFVVSYATMGLYVLSQRAGTPLRLQGAFSQGLTMVFALRSPAWLLESEPGWFLVYSVYSVSGLALLYALFQLLRPVLIRQPATAVERERARSIITTYRAASLARLALRPDKSYFFTPGGSVVAFQINGRAAVALGDPIGPPEDLPQAVEAFAEYCVKNDWTPGFYQVLAQHWPHYERVGFDSMIIGHEAVIDLTRDNLNGDLQQSLRQTVSLLMHQGYRVECHPPPHSPELLVELRLINDEWLTMMHAAESGFALSWFDDAFIRESPLVLVYTPSGVISAFATLIPDRRQNIASIDLLRHRPQVAEGTTELLAVKVLQWARSEGFDRVHLGVSLPEDLTDPTPERVKDYKYRVADETYTLVGFYSINANFSPHWLPRYLIYPGTTALPAIWNTINYMRAGDASPWLFLKQRL